MNALGGFQFGRGLFGVLAVAFACSSALAQEGADGALAVSTANTVLNQYATLAANANQNDVSFSVSNVADLTSSYGALAAGDLVMLYQAQGATISGADTAAFGAVTDLGSAGRYEIVTVGSVSGNTITLDASCGGLDFSYATAGNAQVVRIPQFTTLMVNAGASVVASAWNGTRGGVVAVQAQSLVLNGTVSASGLGFRGGVTDNSTSTAGGTSVTTYRSTANTSGGEKGESIAGFGAAYDALGGRYGRGAPANGGGGGNGHNAGGGGGANGNNGAVWSGQGLKDLNLLYTTAWARDPGNASMTTGSGGGRGGYTYSANNLIAGNVSPGDTAWGGDFRRELGGLGGRPLDNDAAGRLFFGGGGGAGDGNNNGAGAGGAGGGLVFVVAGTVSGSGTVASSGNVGANSGSAFNDAPGGGGGGGTVIVRAATLSGVGVQANGGVGGNQPITGAEAEGPGGGGGGGFIATSGGTVTRTAGGGANGTTTSSSLTEFPPNGATSGAAGATTASAATAPVCTIPVGTVTGTVFSDANRDGAQGGGENAFTAATVTVTLTNTTTGQTFTTTTATGSYTFNNNVPTGIYTVTASASGYSVTTAARSVTVTSGTSATVGVIGLATSQTPTACTVTYGGGFGATPTASPGTAPFNVYPINPATGAAGTTLFATPYQVVAMARHPTLNRLYYIENATGATAARVGYYDFVSGAQFAVGSIDKSADPGNFTRFGFNAAGVGYASISANNAVYQINVTGTETISTTRLGTISAELPVNLSGDFAITAANAAWLSANGNVYRIDLGTLVAVEIINTGNATVNGVAFDTNNDLLLSDTTTVYRVNLGTLAFSTVGSIGSAALSADLANCFVPTLTPNLTVAKTVTGSVTPGGVLTYSITLTNSGNAVSTSTALTDLIPANTSYVVGTTTLNGTAVADDADGGDADTALDMPFVNGSPVNSPVNGTTTYSSGTLAVGGAGAATVTFQVRVDNPLASSVTQISNQGTVTYAPNVSVQTDGDPGTAGAQATTSTVTGRDFGDAPDTASGTATGNYQTLGSDNGSSHTLTANLKLGSATTDADAGTLQDAAAAADDASATDDEDGVASFPYISTAAGQIVTVPVNVTNTTGAAATLVGYLDFNKDGDFADLGEQSGSVSVASGAGTQPVNVIFPATLTGLTAGTTYARFRISSTAGEVASSVGAASSGEVEDYLVVIGAPNLTISKTHTPASFVQGSTGSYTITVGNNGNQPTSGTVTVVDTLPAGLSVPAGTFTPGGTNGAAWSCTAAGQTVTCTTTAGTVIAVGGSSAFSFNVNVAANAASPQLNNVSVSGGGEPAANNTDNAASDSTPIVAPTNLTLTKADTGNFTVGGTGTYSFTVTNAGGAPSSGVITVTDPLPTGLSFVAGSVAGAGWSCSANTATPQTVTCTSSTAITASGSSTFTFDVNVGVGVAVPTITNTASVVGGGDTTPGGASDATTVLSPNLTVAKTHTPASFIRGSTGTYSITVRNSGTAPTSAQLTVTDTLPAGLSVPAGTFTPGGANGSAWSCSASGQTVTCTSSVSIPVGGSSILSFPVSVATSAAPSVTNEARVSGGNEATVNDTPYSAATPSNTARDVTPTVDAGTLTLSKTVRNVTRSGPTGVTSTGEPGDVLEYCIGYTNPGGSTVTNTVLSDTVPANTLALLTPYAGNAVQWTVTAPTSSVQTLSAGADADAGELSTLLTVRLGTIPPAGAGRVCFRVTIR